MKTTLSVVIRSFISILLVLNVTAAVAQLSAVPSAAFTWDDLQQTKLKGSTTFLESFQVDIVVLKPGNKNKKTSAADGEELIIIKEGQLGINLDDKSNVIGPGSVAFIMPNETYSVQNKGTENAIFYRLNYKSKSAINKSRGQLDGGSFVINWDTVAMKKHELGGRRDFFNRPTATCVNFEMHVTTLNEGLPSHAAHTHPAEEIILLIKGDATMAIDNKDYTGSAGDLFFLASGSLHGIRNSGKGECEYFAFQWK